MLMFWKIKLKSFGLTESAVASVIVIIVLSAAVALSSSAVRTTQINSSYSEAQNISEQIFEVINTNKSLGRVYFDNAMRAPQLISIDCFDTTYFHSHPSCIADINEDEYPFNLIPYLNATFSNGYYLTSRGLLSNPAFPDNYFSYKVVVKTPSECYQPEQVSVPNKKCRIITTDIKWQEPSGEKHYKQAMYLTDWER